MTAGPSDGTDTTRAIDRAVALLDSRIGMRPDRAFRNRLGRCITDEAATRGRTVHDYVESLAADNVALQDLLNRVTVQETSFFRHPAQFEVLAQDVLPGLARPVTIWCAASANGQEAYTLAMVLEERGVAGSIVASDVSTAALARMATGWYHDREVSGLSAERRDRHLRRVGEGWEVSPALRDRVRPMRHNLLDPVPDVVRTCPIVFCRNVLIYFSSERSALLLADLADHMPSDSFLFVGGAETLWHLTERFEPALRGDTFVYRPVRAAAAKPVPETMVVRPRRSVDPDAPTRRPTRRRTRRAPVATPSSTAGHDDPGARVAPGPPAPASGAADLEAQGHAATSAGAHVEAVAAFRKWAYVEPEAVLAHLNLGLALERSGDPGSARSAYTTAQAALRHCDPVTIEDALGGYRMEELSRLLDLKLEATAR